MKKGPSAITANKTLILDANNVIIARSSEANTIDG